MKALVFIAVAAMFAGCADSHSQLDGELQPYVGKNVGALSGRLGPPTTQKPATGGTQYTWVTTRDVTGIVDGQEFQSTQSNQQTGRVSSRCTLQALVDPSGVIKSYTWDGNCDRYAAALK